MLNENFNLPVDNLIKFFMKEKSWKIVDSIDLFEEFEKSVSDYFTNNSPVTVETPSTTTDPPYKAEEVDQLSDLELRAISKILAGYNWAEKLPQNLGFSYESIGFDTSDNIVTLQRLLSRWRYRTRMPKAVQIQLLIKASSKSFPKKTHRFIKKSIKELNAETKLSRLTVIDYFYFIRQVCTGCMNDNAEVIGGPGVEFEINESLLY
ncbi:hypothetical protein RF11_00561 [Thelohanellus kitauei]|uniref:Uncharacterized protein n=1 Tax=Thelohanellus kitauei TaxID=669202 RepID=A0A0C2NJJ2_THEKT|nr:hypothetical protein RF11_00561 [Thelohanellus kitauei]